MKLLTQRFAALHFAVVSANQQPGNIQKMDWVPIVFIVFKVAVFGTGMFFAIKWHYDQGKKAKSEASRSQMPAERTPGES